MSALLVDAHVHFHDCFDADAFLDGAAAHFEAGARELGIPDPGEVPGCLMFTESAWDHQFRRFRDGGAGACGWRIEPTAEDHSALAVGQGGRAGHRIALVAGRQVVTGEGLEVLALATDREFPDGRPIREALSAVRESGALAGIPWGFGKWWFARGALVAEVLEEQLEAEGAELFLGDNGGRPKASREHPLFARARALGIPVLPGSDPLPFPRQQSRAGSIGFALRGGADLARPGGSVLDAVRKSDDGGFPRFGALEGAVAFVRDQLAMQLRRRGGRR